MNSLNEVEGEKMSKKFNKKNHHDISNIVTLYQSKRDELI